MQPLPLLPSNKPKVLKLSKPLRLLLPLLPPHKQQQQVQEAQAEVASLKQMMASKEIEPITSKTGSAADLLASSDPTLDKLAAISKKYPALKLRG